MCNRKLWANFEWLWWLCKSPFFNHRIIFTRVCACVCVCCDPQVIAIGFTIMVIRYLDAGHLLSSSSRSQRRERLLLAVRTYLRKQWLHFFSLAVCSLLILADTMTTCDDNFGSYMTSAAFPGLGLLLSLDRLTSLGKEERTPQFGAADASPSSTLARGASENMELQANTANLRSFPPVSESPFGAAGYRLLDFSSLLEHLISYLRYSA